MTKHNLEQFFSALWADYVTLSPQAKTIHDAFSQHNSQLINDHVAFRTFDIPSIDISSLEQHLLEFGYQVLDNYHFPDKHLSACAYIHPKPENAKIFLSQLHIDQLSEENQQVISHKLSTRAPLPDDASIFYSGRSWSLPDWEEYKKLRAESEYAAWLLTLGFHANHFTLDMNALDTHNNWQALLSFIEELGITMNRQGGLIKGNPNLYLEQASTLADEIQLEFDQGLKPVKTCFYEFAKRYKQENGQFYQGFVTDNANQIFSSTNSA
jgi:hypothetical protein